MSSGVQMSQEEQAMIIGKVLLEHKEKSELLQKLKVKANGMGARLAEVAQLLQQNPAHLTFQGHSFDMRFASQNSFSPSLIDFEAINGLCEQIRAISIEVSNLEDNKRNLGF